LVEVKSYGTDRYGRTLGVIFVGGKNVNLEMVRAGLTEVYRGKPADVLDQSPIEKPRPRLRRPVLGRGNWGINTSHRGSGGGYRRNNLTKTNIRELQNNLKNLP
jgi:hypothetical protein